jgi:hypothetical protein
MRPSAVYAALKKEIWAPGGEGVVQELIKALPCNCLQKPLSKKKKKQVIAIETTE